MGEVIEASFVTRLDIPAERILRKAQDADLSTAVVIGWDADGDFYFASTAADGGDVLWLLELAKKKLLEAVVA
jgi:hypothetical protein